MGLVVLQGEVFVIEAEDVLTAGLRRIAGKG
jgi:hypothetical protein